MTSMPALTVLTSLAFAGGAVALMGIAIERQRARRVLAAALSRPASVERAWVSAPDETGLRSLFVQRVGDARPSTVASDFEVDEVVRRFSQAGIRIGYAHDDLAA